MRLAPYFSGKTVLVTGGSSGIGLALAERLGQVGAKLLLLSSAAAENAAAVERLAAAGSMVAGVVCDIGDSAQVATMHETVLLNHGCPDIIINNAGFATYRTFEQSDLAEVVRLADVNFIGALRVTKVFLNAMIERRSGHIVNVASIAGAMLLTPNAIYGGAKHGMVAWSRCLGYEVRRFGLGVSVICPGRVETAFFDHETFKTRAPRRETEMTVPMAVVVEKTLAAIAAKRSITYIPGYLGLVAWSLKALPLLLEPIFGRLLIGRIETLYRGDPRKGYR